MNTFLENNFLGNLYYILFIFNNIFRWLTLINILILCKSIRFTVFKLYKVSTLYGMFIYTRYISYRPRLLLLTYSTYFLNWRHIFHRVSPNFTNSFVKKLQRPKWSYEYIERSGFFFKMASVFARFDHARGMEIVLFILRCYQDYLFT